MNEEKKRNLLRKELEKAERKTNCGGLYTPTNCKYMMTMDTWEAWKERASVEELKEAVKWFNHDHTKSALIDGIEYPPYAKS